MRDIEYAKERIMKAKTYPEAKYRLKDLRDIIRYRDLDEEKEAIDALIEIMDHKVLGIRHDAAIHLAEEKVDINHRPQLKRAGPALLKKLDSKDEDMVAVCAQTLGEIGYKKAVPAINKLLKHENKDIVWHATIGLGKMPDKRSVSGLIKTLAHDDKNVAEYSASALGNIGDKRAIPALAETMLYHNNDVVAWYSAMALNKIVDKKDLEVIPALVKSLGHSDSRLVNESLKILSKIGKPAISAFVGLMEDEHSTRSMVQNSADMLSRIGKPAVKPLIKLLSHDKHYVVYSSARALGEIGDTKALVHLMKLAGTFNEDYQNDAVKSAIQKIQEAQKHA